MKRSHAAKEGLRFELSYEEVERLLQEAKITSDDWSITGYHLSRYNDSGDYTWGNCRFLPYRENYRERKVSEASREVSRINAVKGHAALKCKSPEELSEIGRKGGKIGGGSSKLSKEELQIRFELVKHLGVDSWGFLTKASQILGTSSQHVGRMRIRWKQLGLF